MPGLAGAISSLGLLALPAIASPAYLEARAPADTWSLSITDSSSIEATTPPTEVAASDGWSLSVADNVSGLATYPSQVSQLSLLAVPGGWIDVGAKAFTAENPVAGSDAWLLAWIEDPTSELTIDNWDIWRLAWNDATPSLSISQTFAASDVWALGWLDVSSVLASGALPIEPSDTWSLQLVDDATVAATVEATDEWSLSITDAASIDVIEDAKAGTDTWSLTWSLETTSIGVVADIPILSSDEWRLVLTETAAVSTLTSAVSALRIVRVPRRTIIVRSK